MIPSWAKWIVAFATILPLAAGIGIVLGIGPGNAVFMAGAGAILGSLFYIRLGGDKAIVDRTIHGKPILGVDEEKRKKEIGTGLRLFLLGAALWAALGVYGWFR